MTGSISLSRGGIPTIDFTNLNCTVQYVSTNPLFVTSLIPSVGTPNQFTLNLSLLSVRITLTFDLTDGIGAGSNFRNIKLYTTDTVTVGHALDPITFTWGSDTYKVDVESFVASTQPGKLDYMPGCTLVLVPHI